MGDMTLKQMAADLTRHAATADARAGKVVAKGALTIKTKARANAGHTNAGKTAAVRHINYDMRGPVDAEIGYDKPAGALGTMNEYGSAGNTPDNALQRALESEAPEVERWLDVEEARSW